MAYKVKAAKMSKADKSAPGKVKMTAGKKVKC